MQFKIPFVETVTARSAQAEQMGQIFPLGVQADKAKPIGNHYIFGVVHVATF